MTIEGGPGTDLNPGERLLVAALALVLGCAIAVWFGAAMAAALGGSRLPVGFSAGLSAASRLPGHLSDPRRAWPAPAAATLPGPILYWSATLLVAVAAAALAATAVRVWRRISDPGRVRLGVDVRARFATRRDLAPLIVNCPPPAGRFALGTADGVLLATEDRALAPIKARSREMRARQGDRGSVAIIGPSRCGKTTNVIASLLDWPGPAVVVSVKRDLLDTTVLRRSRIGEIAVFDPAGVSRIDTDKLARWSPLRRATSPSGAQQAAAALAAAIPRAGVEGGMDYWTKQAEILLAGLLGAAALDEDRTMVDVARWVFNKDMPAKDRPSEILSILQSAIRDPDQQEAAEAAIVHLDAVWKLDERVRSSVYATLQTVVQPWLDPTVRRSAQLDDAQRGWVDLEWLCGTGEANSLYLVAPLHDQHRLSAVLGGLIGDLKDQAYQWDVEGRRLPHPLLLLVDEAANMPLSWLPEVASTCAGIGILLVTVWQSKGQIDFAYGRLADSVLTNHLTKVFFAGCSDPSTLEYVSRLLGEEEVTRRSWSFDVGGSRRRSISEGPAREALSPYHLLRQVRPGEGVLIHGTLPPAHIHARRYWDDPRLRALHETGDAPTRPRQRAPRRTQASGSLTSI